MTYRKRDTCAAVCQSIAAVQLPFINRPDQMISPSSPSSPLFIWKRRCTFFRKHTHKHTKHETLTTIASLIEHHRGQQDSDSKQRQQRAEEEEGARTQAYAKFSSTWSSKTEGREKQANESMDSLRREWGRQDRHSHCLSLPLPLNEQLIINAMANFIDFIWSSISVCERASELQEKEKKTWDK